MVLNLTRARAALIASVASICWATGVAAQRSPNTAPLRARPLLFGFALECTDCDPGMRGRGRSGGGGRGASTILTYTSYPHVIAVAPGSAAERAGIRPGDILQEIDGMSVLTSDAAARFANAAPGEKVTLGVERAGKPILFSLVLGPPTLPSTGGERILSGYMALNGTMHGDMTLDFWSDEQIHMVADSITQTMTFQIGNGTIIRLKFTKDTTDAANRPGAKKDGSQWF